MVARSRSTCHYSTSIEGMIQNRKLQSTSCGLLEKDARTGTEEEIGGKGRGGRGSIRTSGNAKRGGVIWRRGELKLGPWLLFLPQRKKGRRRRVKDFRILDHRSFRFGGGIGEYLLAAIIAVGIQYEIKIHYVWCV